MPEKIRNSPFGSVKKSIGDASLQPAAEWTYNEAETFVAGEIAVISATVKGMSIMSRHVVLIGLYLCMCKIICQWVYTQ